MSEYKSKQAPPYLIHNGEVYKRCMTFGNKRDFTQWTGDNELGPAHIGLEIEKPGDNSGFEYWFYKRVESKDTDTFIHELLWETDNE